MGDGYNILIDTHGWYCQTIVSGGWSGDLFQTFQDYFPGNSYASLRGAEGYYSAWAAYELGYDACLFEFPSVSSARDFREKGVWAGLCGSGLRHSGDLWKQVETSSF